MKTQILLSVKDLCAIFGVTPQTIQRWSRDGRLPAIRTAGNHRRFALDDVRALLVQLQQPAAPEPKFSQRDIDSFLDEETPSSTAPKSNDDYFNSLTKQLLAAHAADE